MRCPKCGAFMEDGKENCLMCGVNVRTYVPESNVSTMFSNNNSNFGSGNDFRNQAGRFGQPPVNQSNFNDYKKASYAPLKNEDKDFFDKYQEHKGLYNTIIFGVILLIIAIVAFSYFRSKNKPLEMKPVIQNLYFAVDESFVAVSGNSSASQTYIKSGDKGNACSITINVGSSTSQDHVDEYFKSKKEDLEPKRDSNNKVINELEIYTAQDSSLEINNTMWYYMNVFYKKDVNSDATLLRYKYMTALDKGYYYDIELVNNSNDSLCNASLDNFAKSLKFINS